MKKIFTLIVSTTLFTSAFAQYNAGDKRSHGYDNGKDIAVNDNKNRKDDHLYNDSHAFANRAMDMQIMQINRDFDTRIQVVKNRLFISRIKKARMIASLENQRDNEIKKVYAKFNNKHDRFDDKKSKGRW